MVDLRAVPEPFARTLRRGRFPRHRFLGG
jgi:hypothetical protein